MCSDISSMVAPDGPESVFRSVADAEVSLDEMLSLACRQGKQDIVELLLESGAKVNYRNKAGNTPLLEACSQGHVTIASLLLDRNADIDAPTETTSDSALTWACTLGNEDIVQLLLENKASIEHRTRDGCTALMFAALAGHENVSRLLLEHGAKLNVESDSNKDSPLTFACWKGHQKVVELFLAHKANIEHRTKEGFSPLMFAALGGHTEVARLLLEKKAEVNNPSGSNNDIPLTSACWKGHHAVVDLLLHYNSNIEHHTKDGCTPLMLAAREGHFSVAQLLLHHYAKVNVPSGSENNIPLTLACWKGHKDVVELLLQYNSNIEHQNKAGCTPLMLAAREGHHEATELLLDHGAQLNVPSGSNDDTPLTLACWKGHEGVVGLLLEKQSSINHQTKTGCTPLMEATREGHVGVARMLLEANADVETPDNYGQTPFFMACWKGHAEVAGLLLDYGANKDCRTKTGITPFFQACRENHVEVVKLLLDYGCNPSSPFPNSRECPLTLAAEKGFTELTQVLISRNANMECRTKKGCTPFFLTCKEGFQEIAITLVKHGADTEATDQRGITPLLAAFRNGHVEIVDWLLGHVAHLPSDLDCQKALIAPKSTEKEVFPSRSKCLELIMKAKKAREQAALKNAQSLFEELDAEKEKKEIKRKALLRKRTKRKEKKKKDKAEKTIEVECDAKEEEEEEEEDEELTRPHPQPDDPPLPVPTRKSSKRNKKRTNNENGLATPTSSSTTAATRTSLQTPAHLINDSWEEEESGDEMFVDAPSEFLPDIAGKPPEGSDKVNGHKKNTGPNGKSRDLMDNERNNKQAPPTLKYSSANSGRSQKLKSSKEEVKSPGPVKRTNSRKDEGPPKSPNNDRRKKSNYNKSPDHYYDKKSRRCESPVYSRDDDDEEEGENWDEELEPSVDDWDNEQQQTPFIAKQISKTRSWSTVATATTAVSTATSSASSSTTTSSKNWQEVSRAIKTHQLTVSNSLVGRIIGRKGMKINQIQSDSGAQISISRAIPRSVERLVTIKGTERSVATARELIEIALSTSSRENEETTIVTTPTPLLQTTPPLISATPTQTTTTSVTTNPWTQSVWGQKKYSDVVPPTSITPPTSVTPPISTSVTPPTSTQSSPPVSEQKDDSVARKPSPSNVPPVTTPPITEPIVTNQDTTPTEPVAIVTRTGSLPTSDLLPNEEEEDLVIKQKRSFSEPNDNSIIDESSSQTTPIISSPEKSSEETNDFRTPSRDLVSSTKPVAVTTPSTSVIGVPRTTPRMVGVVTPTQSVKPYQRETTPTQILSSSVSITVTSTTDTNTSRFTQRDFGAIGPPNRRNSLPVTANHFDSSDYANSRKFSYAGIPMVQPVGSGSLGVVHESFPVMQRDYNWPPPPPPPGPLPPPPHAPPTPSFMHNDWMGGVNFNEHERVRSQSWAGLPPPPPGGTGNFGPPHDFPLSSNNNRGVGGAYHFENEPIPHAHSHGGSAHSWGKPYHQPHPQYQFRPPPPPNYHPHHPPGARNTTGNYGNNIGYYEQSGGGQQSQHDNYRNWAPPPPGYHHTHKTNQSCSGSEPLSLRQVLGEKLEQEIFPGEGGGLDFPLKDDPSPSKRWSVSSFPPQISSAHNNLVNGGVASSSTWGPGHNSHTSRHSVIVSPFQQSDTAISDLAASWPIWSSPVPTSRQPQSPFSPSPSSSLPNGSDVGNNEDGWSSMSRGGLRDSNRSPSDLVELMRSLDIAEHIPVLKTRKLSLEQLCDLTEEGWRELNLPVGPRVKLMNAINSKSLSQDKLSVSSKAAGTDSIPPTSSYVK